MAAGAPGGGGDGRPHHVGQLSGGGQRAGGHDGPGDAAGEPCLTVVGEDLDQGVLVVLVDHIGGGAARRRVHPHVEGGVPAVGEPAPATSSWGELTPRSNRTPRARPRRRGSRGRPGVPDDSGQGVEPGLADGGPAPERGQLLAGRGHGQRVAVDPEDGDAGPGLEQGAEWPRSPDGGVDDQAAGHRAEQLDHLGGHDRLVGECLAHPQSLDRHDSCGWSAATVRLEVGGGGFFQRSGRGTAHGPDTFDVHVVTGTAAGPIRTGSAGAHPGAGGRPIRRARRLPRGDDQGARGRAVAVLIAEGLWIVVIVVIVPPCSQLGRPPRAPPGPGR